MRLGFDLHGAVPGILGVDSCVTPPFAKFHYHCTSYSIATISYNTTKQLQRYGFFCATTAKQAFIFAGSTIFSLFDGMLRPCSE